MRTVLLVDDSPVARRVLARRLASAGFVVNETSSADIARETDPTSLTCAILDLELGDVDGTDVAAALLDRRATLPIAFFSAGASQVLLDRARARGPVFDKPDVDAIVDWVLRTAND